MTLYWPTGRIGSETDRSSLAVVFIRRSGRQILLAATCRRRNRAAEPVDHVTLDQAHRVLCARKPGQMPRHKKDRTNQRCSTS